MNVVMSERLRKRIDALRIEYVKTFDEEARGFESELELGDLSALAKRAHRIAGTAGSYQLDDVCAAAQAVERLSDHADPDAPNGAPKTAVVDERALHDAVRHLCGTLNSALSGSCKLRHNAT